VKEIQSEHGRLVGGVSGWSVKLVRQLERLPCEAGRLHSSHSPTTVGQECSQ
jgi:hypothetical protein